ncbi:Bromodomain containing protein [Trichomonas vaginalis G3]|uniref:Bromodomain containing protein n=1 Tax=Trichomonas vaginalis (strain ATCC PRA-98 / G3) TaxID=412133 RepID=A2FPY0_TRIV3|nr:bromodomain family [Trichomonas vaginalis G3]EAX93039.1 Bromodomain containing protein [Trichomonas vaginalis G3]KAI5543785.1 bromodomain family [Trichomonas vaginalis G3]|eukprot:XP_001305969.1 Bromodomain containing protein [Trichomonas vaginalis G3]
MKDNKEAKDDYDSKISNPISLDIIEKKVENDEYSSLFDFRDDINLMFANVQKYFPEDSIVYKISDYFHNIIKKYFLPFDKSNWIAEVSQKRNKIQNLLFKPVNSSSQQSGIDLTKCIIEQVVSEEVYARMKKNNNLLSSPEHQKILIGLINHYQPDIVGTSTTLNLDLTKLKPPTLQALDQKMQELAKTVLDKQNITEGEPSETKKSEETK